MLHVDRVAFVKIEDLADLRLRYSPEAVEIDDTERRIAGRTQNQNQE